MKKNLHKTASLFIFLLLISAGALFSQTSGTFSFSVTTTSTGGYSPSHLIAIWIENAATSFIKTKIKYSSPDNYDHLATWVNKSGQNVTDAVSGATLTSHGTLTFLWNGTNVGGTLVPDGAYFVWLEMAWGSSLSTGKTVNSYAFTKGPAVVHLTPPNTTNFLSMVLDWTPSTTAVEGVLENKDISVYPNPSTGLVNIDFKKPHEAGTMEIIGEDGKIVYWEKLQSVPAGTKTFDLSGLSDGLYFCRLNFAAHEFIFTIILIK